jgi:hypothetical protein
MTHLDDDSDDNSFLYGNRTQQLGASIDEKYEKQCALERQRLEMMSSMMQASNQLQNQQMVSLMTMLAQRLPMAPQPASNKRDRDDHYD